MTEQLDVNARIEELEKEVAAIMEDKDEVADEKKKLRIREEKLDAKAETACRERELLYSVRDLLHAKTQEHNAKLDALRQVPIAENPELREGLLTLTVKAAGGSGITVSEIEDIATLAGIDLEEDIKTDGPMAPPGT